ncbi:MAG: PorT family protein [Bacteroidia bacterium]|nr:PorT family protein [Bacteroidia bacterium]
MKWYKSFVCLIGFICFSNIIWAQTDSIDTTEEDDPGAFERFHRDMDETHIFGLRLGSNISSLLGNELENPTIAFGLNGALYYRYKVGKKSAIQTEAGFSIRGSNFNNKADEYETIKLYYLDIPIYWVRSLNNKNTSNLVLGLQYSQLMNATIKINPQILPDSQVPKFKKEDVAVAGGLQFYGGIFGFQCMIKYGLLNINDGLIPNLKPLFKNKDIHNFALDINFLF